MQIDSTQPTLTTDVKKKSMKTPYKSSINFLRQFARSYTYINDVTGGLIAN